MAEENKELAASLKELTDAAKNPEGARNILAMLFPKADQVLETYISNEQGNQYALKRQRRISQQEFASTYFRLDPVPISWSRSELEELFKLGPQRALDAVEARVEKYDEKDNARLRRQFLEFLTAALSQRGAFSSEWFYRLMMVSPMYILRRERKPWDLLSDDGFMIFDRLLFQALRPLSPDERYLLIVEKLSQLEDLSVFAGFFRSAAGDTNPDGSRTKDVPFFGARTEELRDQLVAMVRQLALSGQFWDQISPVQLLWFWWGANHEEEVREFLLKSMHDPTTLERVLDASISPVVSSAGNYERVSRSFERLIDLNVLKERALDLLDRAPNENTTTVTRFLRALERSESSSF